MAHDAETVTLKMILIHTTEKARLLAVTEEVDGEWFPKSQMKNIEVVGSTNGGVALGKSKVTRAPSDGAEIIQFDIPKWLAAKKDLA